MSDLSKNKVVIVRLKGSNQELVTRLEYGGLYAFPEGGVPCGLVRLHDPMRLGFVQGPDTMNYLQLGLWNPLSLYKDRHFDIDPTEILCTSEASNPLAEYYLSVVKKWDDMVADQPDREFAKVKTIADLIGDLEKQDDEESLSRGTKNDSDTNKMN